MSNVFENKGAMAATIVVAASNSLNQGQANYVCDGVNDHVEIQAALDALPATGGEVLLLDGTYYIEVGLTLDSNQTLRGCGRNTILTTTTAGLNIITAVGGPGTEKVHVVIRDLQVDGGAGLVSSIGIRFNYVDHSSIENVYSRRHRSMPGRGIGLQNADFNKLIGNTCHNNKAGIHINASCNNIISDNTCDDNENGIFLSPSSKNIINTNAFCNNTEDGIYLASSDWCTLTGNTCQNNGDNGIYVSDSHYNTIADNIFSQNGQDGVWLGTSCHNTIVGNTLTENSQDTTNLYDCIYLDDSDYNNIQGNTCRAGALANVPRYGINVSNAGCDKNLVTNNDLYDDGFGTGSFHDVGTCTTVKSSNRGIQITDVKDYVYIKNTSGGASAVGDVARHKAVAAGNEYDTPTANGEDSVLGMVAEVIANNASGLVQVGGKTTRLKATNAGGNIAIGDYLCSEIGVRARLAAAGDMAFARALEACAAADCTIDALIVSPMKM